MTIHDLTYLGLVRDVLLHGGTKRNRTGVDTISMFARSVSYDLELGFPLFMSRELNWKAILIETLWYLRGESNVEYLHKHGVHVWDPWADKDGEIPVGYGEMWRHFPDILGVEGIDQIRWLDKELRHNPNSRRLVVSAWHPEIASKASLPPCHAFWVLNVQYGKLNLHLTQRSADLALGVPFNVASYALILRLFARFSGLKPGVLHHTMVDAHAYVNHLDGLKEQIGRITRPEPSSVDLVIDYGIKTLSDVLEASDLETDEILEVFHVEGYTPRPKIKFEVAI